MPAARLVIKVHMEVLRYARDGYTILFVGHRNHDEAVGTVGEAPDNIIVVETPEEVMAVKVPDERKVAFVTQTTLSLSDAMRVIDAIRIRFPNVRAPAKDDICYATTNRQNAVTELGRRCGSGDRDRLAEQFQQQAIGRNRRDGRQGSAPDRRCVRGRSELVRWQEDGFRDGRRIGAGTSGGWIDREIAGGFRR